MVLEMAHSAGKHEHANIPGLFITPVTEAAGPSHNLRYLAKLCVSHQYKMLSRSLHVLHERPGRLHLQTRLTSSTFEDIAAAVKMQK